MSTASHPNTCLNDSGLSHNVTLINPAVGELCMKENQHLRMHDASGWIVQATTGIVWITQEADSRDIVLKPGDAFVLDRPGSTLISSLGEARICLKRGSSGHVMQADRKASKFFPSFASARALFA